MTRVGLFFPGEMGAAVGGAARADVLWASEGRSKATAERAAAAGLHDVRTIVALAGESEIVLSICPPAIAEAVAADVAAAGFRGVYVEANAVSPARAERIAADLRRDGIGVVDGSIISRAGINLYLSGDPPDVERVAALFADSDVTAIPLGEQIGAASALKMAFGGWNKIGIALTAQALAIARAYGVEQALAGEGVDGERVVRAAPKAWRWAPEMEEVAATCVNLGLPGELGRGAADLYERWAAHRDRSTPLEVLLEDLREPA